MTTPSPRSKTTAGGQRGASKAIGSSRKGLVTKGVVVVVVVIAVVVVVLVVFVGQAAPETSPLSLWWNGALDRAVGGGDPSPRRASRGISDDDVDRRPTTTATTTTTTTTTTTVQALAGGRKTVEEPAGAPADEERALAPLPLNTSDTSEDRQASCGWVQSSSSGSAGQPHCHYSNFYPTCNSANNGRYYYGNPWDVFGGYATYYTCNQWYLKAFGHCRRPPCPRHRGIPRRYRRPPPSPGDSWGPLGTMSEASQSLSLFWLALLSPWRFCSVCPRPSQSNICAFQLLFGAYWSFLKPYQGAIGVKSGPVAASSVKQKPLGIISDKSTII